MLDGTPAPKSSRPAGLSERELEILRLLASGMTYRGIAQQLVITSKTVDHHVQHIYNKLGVSTRAAATMFALEHRLIRASTSLFPR